MSNVSQKCQYALRALFELAKRRDEGVPLTVAEMSQAQAIPARFLEQILMQLRQGGYVESRRGVAGGYVMTADPAKLTVGEIIQFLEGPISPVKGLDGGEQSALTSDCVFMIMWKEARDALSEVYDRWTFEELLARERLIAPGVAYDFSI